MPRFKCELRALPTGVGKTISFVSVWRLELMIDFTFSCFTLEISFLTLSEITAETILSIIFFFHINYYYIFDKF